MIRTVVKWSYIKGAKGLQRAKAHINYLQYREGRDRESGPRQFFDARSNSLSGRDIKNRLEQLEQNGVQLHKFILSPGLNSVEMDIYTRELMEKLSRGKGLNLEWYAVEHDNTAHVHAHVLVMGVDLNGRQVQFKLEDHRQLRQWGDKYLEREHHLERYLDGELERLLENPTTQKEIEYRRAKGDRQFERWMYGDSKEKREKESARGRQDWELFDRGLRGDVEQEHSSSRPRSYKQYQLESTGRLLYFHEKYQEQEFQKYWSDIAENHPELTADAVSELEWLHELSSERRESYAQKILTRY